MVAKTCCYNWIKDATVCLRKCRFGRFLGKILVVLKKSFSSTFFPDFRYVPVPGLLYIYLGIHARR